MNDYCHDKTGTASTGLAHRHICAQMRKAVLCSWNLPIEFISWGLLFTSIQISLPYLYYILPTIGVLLLFAGVCCLRPESRSFRAAWVFSILFVLAYAASLVGEVFPKSIFGQFGTVIAIFQCFIRIGLLLELRAGIISVYMTSSRKPSRDPLKWASVWTVLSLAIALISPYSSIYIVLALLLWDIIICCSLSQLGHELEADCFRT